MIDSHTHTKYSKHATGNVEDLVKAAIDKNIRILTITDHAPFYIDTNNRLLISELKRYSEEIDHAKDKYSGSIRILKGLEADFLPNNLDNLSAIISDIELDYLIGSIHYIFVGDKRINVWDIESISHPAVISQYFVCMKELLESGLFDAVGHPDAILRGGIPDSLYYEHFHPLITLMKKNDISYELNASGSSKTTYDLLTKVHMCDICSYPSWPTVAALNANGVSFTIGSDAHAPEKVGNGIDRVLQELQSLGLTSISYYEKRKRIDVALHCSRLLL